MRCVILCACALLLLAAGSAGAEWQGKVETIEGVPHVHNPDTPADGVRELELEALWSLGGESEEDEEIFGLVQDIHLELGMNVSEKYIFRFAKLVRQRRFKISKHPQPSVKGLPFDEVRGIPATPPKTLTLLLLDTGNVDALVSQIAQSTHWVIITNHTYELSRM
jgi:hypothetical protein